MTITACTVRDVIFPSFLMKKFFSTLALASVALAGCTFTGSTDVDLGDDAMMDDDEAMMDDGEAMMDDDGTGMEMDADLDVGAES